MINDTVCLTLPPDLVERVPLEAPLAEVTEDYAIPVRLTWAITEWAQGVVVDGDVDLFDTYAVARGPFDIEYLTDSGIVRLVRKEVVLAEFSASWEMSVSPGPGDYEILANNFGRTRGEWLMELAPAILCDGIVVASHSDHEWHILSDTPDAPATLLVSDSAFRCIATMVRPGASILTIR